MKNSGFIFIGLLSLLMGFFACGGKSEQAKQKEETAAQTEENETMNNTPQEDMTAAMKEMEKAMTDMNDGKKVEVVNFRKLQDLLPEKLAGMDRISKEGQTSGAMGFNISTAEAKYKKGDDQTMEIDIVDTGGMGMAMMGMAAWASVTIDKEDEQGYERTTNINGYKAYEKYNKNSQNGEVSVLVGNRFVVTAKGNGMDIDTFKKAINGLDLDQLAKMN